MRCRDTARSLLMDPAVTAAVITTPTAALAAAAAYAAGRFQGRSAQDAAATAARSARDAAATAARSMFEDQAREAQRSAYVSLIEAAHAAGETLESALEQAIEAVSEDPDAITLYGIHPQRRRNDMRMKFLAAERAVLRTALARVELEGPKSLILLARHIDETIIEAESDCSREFSFLVAHRRLDNAAHTADVAIKARNASRSLRYLASTPTPSFTPSQRVACVSFLLSPRDRDIATPARGRDEQAAVLQATHPEECQTLLDAYTQTVNDVGQVVTSGTISQSDARILKIRAARGPDAQINQFTPWHKIHQARVRFTDAARDYLHAAPSNS